MKRPILLCLSIFVMVGLNQPQDLGGNPPPPDEGAFTYMGELNRLGESYSGTADFRFTLWDAPTDGSQVAPMQARKDLTVSDGLFQARLRFDETTFDGAARWLEIEVRTPSGKGRFTTLAPRQQVVSSRHELRDVTADEAGDEGGDDSVVGNESDQTATDVRSGGGASAFRQDRSSRALPDGSAVGQDGIPTALRRADSLGDDGIRIASDSPWRLDNNGIHYTVANAGIGTNSASNFRLFVRGDTAIAGRSDSRSGRGVFGLANSATGRNFGVYGQSKSSRGRGVFGFATATSGANLGVLGQSNSTSGRGVFGLATALSGSSIGGLFESRSTAGRGVVGLAKASTGVTTGVFGRSVSDSGRGVYGIAAPGFGTNFGVFGETASTNGTGVFGLATGITGTTTGVHGQSDSAGGRAIFGHATAITGITTGLHGQNDSTGGRAVFGHATAITGITTGVHGQTDSPGGRAVFGDATTLSGANIGVLGQSSSTTGTAVSGLAAATTGLNYGVRGQSDSISGRGMFGFATAISGTTYGVYGQSSSTDGIGVLGVTTAITGINYGVWGQTNSPDGFAGYFVGGPTFFDDDVGIGTNAPLATLDVRGDIRFGTDAWFFVADGGGFFIVEDDDGTGASATRLHIEDDTGNVGIGTTGPTFLLEVNGTAGKPGGGSWSNSSDRRLKKNIKDLDGVLDQVLALRGVRYEYKDPKAINELEGERIGMIAQDVEKVFPDWVDEGTDGYKRLTFRGFEALTVEALRELRAEKDTEIAEQREQIDGQQEEINSLRERLAELEALVAQLASEQKGSAR